MVADVRIGFSLFHIKLGVIGGEFEIDYQKNTITVNPKLPLSGRMPACACALSLASCRELGIRKCMTTDDLLDVMDMTAGGLYNNPSGLRAVRAVLGYANESNPQAWDAQPWGQQQGA